MTHRTPLTLLMTLLFAGPASAHGVFMDPRVQAGRVVVEAYFDDDTPTQDAKVTAVDQSGAVVAEGRTDDKGVWSFPAPPPGQYKLTLDDGTGHRCTRTLTVEGSGESAADGPPRSAVTGPGKWLAAAGGLLLIAGLTAVARRAARRRS